MHCRTRQDEDGAVLVMALVFLTVAALIVAALLSFSDTNFRTTIAVRDQRNVVYAADGAVDAAINAFRFNGTCPLSHPTVNGVAVGVTCTAATTSSATPSNAPPLAVITRATQTSGEDGIVIASGALTRVRGGAFSNNTINLSAGATLEVAGTLKARFGCNRPELITTTVGTPECTIGNVAYTQGNDPGYAPLVSTAPALGVLPTCPPTGPVLFLPGTYNNAAALNNLFSTCSGRVFHFQPNIDGTAGAYYFDFEDAGSHEWRIAGPSTVVVGGRFPTGVDYLNVASTAVGNRCDDGQPGVQFIFGNDSRLNVESGDVELCADHDPADLKQEIAVYGMTTLHQTAAPAAPVATDLAPVSPTGAVSTTFVPATAARVIDGTTADATVASTDANDSDTITLTGFDVTGIPAGATVNKVEVVFRHRDRLVSPSNAGLASELELKGTVTSPTGGSASLTDKVANCSPRCLTKSDVLHDDTVTVTSTFGTVAKLAGLSATYTADATKKGNTETSFTDHLDGVQLKVNYTPAAAAAVPRFRALTGCATQTPYGAAGTCALVRTGGSQADLAVHGTVYGPDAALDIHLVGVSYQVLQRGVVVRHLRSNVTSSSSCATVTGVVPDSCYPFQLPFLTTATGDVLFTATHDGRVRLRALVQFGSGAAPPVIKAWSVVNETP